MVLENKDEETNTLTLENEIKEEENEIIKEVSNGLENFEIENDTPELFNSENILEDQNIEQESSLYEKDKNEDENEDLEIPAFLRRQKN